MGFLRTILALGVAKAHVLMFSPFIFINGGVSVILFYIISGFYMSLVITEKYKPSGKGWEKRFLLQRALRLLPPYWVILAITLIFYAFIGQDTPFSSSMGMNLAEHILNIFSNIFIIGLDVLLVADVLLVYNQVPDFYFLWFKYPVMIGWTVGVEMTFYIFAALFALRNTRYALVALGIGIYLRIYFLIINGKFLETSEWGIGYSNTPWGYHYFGVCLVFFMLGWLCYQMYIRLRAKVKEDPEFITVVKVVTVALLSLFLLECYYFDSFTYIYDFNDYRLWLAVLVVVPLIPPLFLLTKNSKIDNFVGYFSYPIYLCHYVAVQMGVNILGTSPDNRTVNTILVMGMSTAIVLLVELPIEKFRRDWSKGGWKATSLYRSMSRKPAKAN